MIHNQILRYFHSAYPTWSSVSKGHLAKLRKKTGYTFSNCKKALELNNNDISKAEKWLQDQAEALGWSKLSKLEGRVTAQGLVGVAFEGNHAALVEVNCETDFVARNKNFKEMVHLTSSSCLVSMKNIPAQHLINKNWFDSERMKSVEGPDGKKLSDHVALLVSSVGENVSLNRALCVQVEDNIKLACYVHPDHSDSSNVISGKYGAVIMYSSKKRDKSTEQIVRQLCQHVIGMNPKSLKKTEEELIAKKELEENKKDDNNNEENEENVEEDLMSQDFLLDPSVTVEELLSGSGVTIHDFVRLETGEKITKQEIPEEKAKASQIG